jgi:hypothetical protein
MNRMATETTGAASDVAAAARERRKELASLRRTGALHFAMVTSAITLWGAADAWAVASGWGLAWAVAVANALVAAAVVTGVVHEWAHYAGARLAGAAARVFEEPVRYFFLFDFCFERNDRRQFLWMSWGGILAPWLLVLLTALCVPIDNASRAMLVAAFVARAVQIGVFEVPVALRTAQGAEPRAELGRRVKAGGLVHARWLGLAAGALVWLAA